MSSETSDRNRFLLRTKEKEEHNQYWYSAKTIKAIVAEAVAAGGRGAYVSTPSVYFSVPKDKREGSHVLDYDDQWDKDPGFVKYDFNEPEKIPEELHHQFDFICVDPPFITREVWEKYATTVKLLAKEGGDEETKDEPACRILVSTIVENQEMMKELLDVEPQKFQPSIPNLVYQYNFYCNYKSEGLDVRNDEIPA